MLGAVLGEIGVVEKELNNYNSGEVVGLVVGAFAECLDEIQNIWTALAPDATLAIGSTPVPRAQGEDGAVVATVTVGAALGAAILIIDALRRVPAPTELK